MFTWVFPKIGDFPPKWMVKIMENPMNKWDDLGGISPTYFRKGIHILFLKQSHPGCHIIFTDPQPTQSQERKGGGPSGNLGGFFWRF